jgi:hypothetical protein
MRRYVALLFIAGSLALLAVTPERSSTSARAREVTRVRAHFDSVLRELGAHDVPQLSRAQRSQRTALMAALRTYTERGDFPRNYDFPDSLVPYFVDRKTGVRCAVAYLLESTGRTDIVQRVSATNNNVRARQLAGDSAFTNWLEASGLTLDEAARIQPAYGGDRVGARDTDHYGLASAFALTASLGTTIANVTANDDGRYPLLSVLGITAGAATLGLGALDMVGEDASPGLAWANAVVGTAGMIVGVRSLARRHGTSAVRRNANAQGTKTSRPDIRAIVTPTFSLVGQRSAGVLLQLQF